MNTSKNLNDLLSVNYKDFSNAPDYLFYLAANGDKEKEILTKAELMKHWSDSNLILKFGLNKDMIIQLLRLSEADYTEIVSAIYLLDQKNNNF